jgi:DNA invertase Pin-like site-specific DNA recombinase
MPSHIPFIVVITTEVTYTACMYIIQILGWATHRGGRTVEHDEKKRCAIYTRVSSDSQKVDAQEHELREFAERRGWSVYKVYSDQGISGAKESRPPLNQLMKDCRSRQLEVVAVWKFDRFARSVKQLVTSLDEFHSLGIDFVSLTEQVDTTTPMGTLVFHVLGAVAELERSLIRERTVAGLKEARRKGKRLGRPPVKLNSDLIARIRADRMNGTMSFRKLAKKHQVPLWTVQRLVQRDFTGA